VPPSLLAPLLLDAATPGEAPPDPAVALLLPARIQELGQCLEEPRRSPLERAVVALSFLVEPDGHTSGVRAASQPGEPEAEACAAALAAEWIFPAGSRTAGPFAASYVLEPLPGGRLPGYPGPEGLRPVLKDPACLRPPPGAPQSVALTMKLAVDVDGRPVLVHPLSVGPERLVAQAVEAVRRCRFSPGAGEDGRPALLWTTLLWPGGSR
jgi:hypothetical protein